MNDQEEDDIIRLDNGVPPDLTDEELKQFCIETMGFYCEATPEEKTEIERIARG